MSKNLSGFHANDGLIELKAELHRKQLELLASRSSLGGHSGAIKRQRTEKPKEKKNAGIEKRNAKDLAEVAEAEKTYEKAKSILEAKSRLYETMTADALNHDEHEHPVLANSLVNFQAKALENLHEKRNSRLQTSTTRTRVTKMVDESGVEYAEFTDHFGRTRTCPLGELEKVLAENGLSNDLDNSLPPTLTKAQDETLALDEAREEMHVKWRKETDEAADKDYVHYQDVLYDEVRSHGVGFYAFSKDDAKRDEQLRKLKEASLKTDQTRTRVEEEKRKKATALSERLRKVRERKRAKLGLPPLPPDPVQEEVPVVEEKTSEDTEIDLNEPQKKPEIRPWDFGKSGVFGPKPTNFDELDEKWMRDRRAERDGDFAPPSFYKD